MSPNTTTSLSDGVIHMNQRSVMVFTSYYPDHLLLYDFTAPSATSVVAGASALGS